MAGWDPAAIAPHTYVNAHGTSTKFNDLMETNALKEVFGKSAADLQISSTKSTTGHLIGAACAIEMAAILFAMRDGLLPPTINFQTPDPECDLDYIPNKARQAKVRYALDNSFGFGGHNVCIAVVKTEQP
jgi:3-oxoacyl-[acyl-carrier-protein] synthase II